MAVLQCDECNRWRDDIRQGLCRECRDKMDDVDAKEAAQIENPRYNNLEA